MSDNRDHLRALHAAYVEASGLPISLSHERLKALREMDRRGLTPDDVRVVLTGIKAHIRKGTHGYNENSLDWRNAMGNVDTFEERALKARQAAERRKGIKREAQAQAPKPIEKALPDGRKLTVLAPETPSPEVPPIGEALRQWRLSHG